MADDLLPTVDGIIPALVYVVIYACGTVEQIRRQVEQCRNWAEANGRRIVAVATDPPGRDDGLASARAMVKDGEAAEILTWSRLLTVPPEVTSVTKEITAGRRPRRTGGNDG